VEVACSARLADIIQAAIDEGAVVQVAVKLHLPRVFPCGPGGMKRSDRGQNMDTCPVGQPSPG
jgi:hypothetical protein